MIEQSIYSRASNTHVNANNQKIGIGYGRVASSQGFDAIGGELDKTVGSYPCMLTDVRGAYPKIMAKYEAVVGGEPMQVIQQVTRLQLSSERAFHIGHQYAAVGESVADFVRNPLLWMQLSFLDTYREPIDFPVIGMPALKPSLTFPMATLSDALRYFGMVPDEFEYLLASLFDSRRLDSVFTLILFDDSKPDYLEWIQRLIVHIYLFLPLAMRRRIGFETWFTGSISPRLCQLSFASYRNFSDVYGKYKLKIGPNSIVDVSNCFTFRGPKLIHVEHSAANERAGDMNCSFRKFIRPMIASALAPQQCFSVESTLNQYWSMFDTTPDGRNAEKLEQFDNLIDFIEIQYSRFQQPNWENMASFAEAFYNGLGEIGDAAFAKALSGYRADSSPAAASTLCTLLDRERYGPKTARAAEEHILGGLREAGVKLSQLKHVLHAIRKFLPEARDEILISYIRRARTDLPAQEALVMMLSIASEEALGDAVRDVACLRFRSLLPERIEDAQLIERFHRTAPGLNTERMYALLDAAISRVVQGRAQVDVLMDFMRRQELGPRVQAAVLDVIGRFVEKATFRTSDVIGLMRTLMSACALPYASTLAVEMLRHVESTLKELEADWLLSCVTRIEEDYHPSADLLGNALRLVLAHPELSAVYRFGVSNTQLYRRASVETIVCEFLDARLHEGAMSDAELSSAVALAENPNSTGAILDGVAAALIVRIDRSIRSTETLDFLCAQAIHLPDPLRSELFCRILDRIEVGSEMSGEIYAILALRASEFIPNSSWAAAMRAALSRALDVLPVDLSGLRILDRLIAFCKPASDEGENIALLKQALRGLRIGETTGVSLISDLLAAYARYSQPEIRELVLSMLAEAAERYSFDTANAETLIRKCHDILVESSNDIVQGIFASVQFEPGGEVEYLDMAATLARDGCVNPQTAAFAFRRIMDSARKLQLSVPIIVSWIQLLLEGKIDGGEELFVLLLREAIPSEDCFLDELRELVALSDASSVPINDVALQKAIDVVSRHPVSIEELDAWTSDADLMASPSDREILAYMLAHLSPPMEEAREAVVLRLLDFVRDEYSVVAQVAEAVALGFMKDACLSDVTCFLDRLKDANSHARDRLTARAVEVILPEIDPVKALGQINYIGQKCVEIGGMPSTGENITATASSLINQLPTFRLYLCAETLTVPSLSELASTQLVKRILALPYDRAAAFEAISGRSSKSVELDEEFIELYIQTRSLFSHRLNAQTEVCVKILNYFAGDSTSDCWISLEKILRLIAEPQLPAPILTALGNALERFLSNRQTSFAGRNTVDFQQAYHSWVATIESCQLLNRDAVLSALILCCARSKCFSNDQFEELLALIKEREGTRVGEAAFSVFCAIVEAQIETVEARYGAYRSLIAQIGDDILTYRVLSRAIVDLEARRPKLNAFLQDIWKLWNDERFHARDDRKRLDELNEWLALWICHLHAEATHAGSADYLDMIYSYCVSQLGNLVADAASAFRLFAGLASGGRLNPHLFSEFLRGFCEYLSTSQGAQPIFREKLFDPFLAEGIGKADQLGVFREEYARYLTVRLGYLSDHLVPVLFYGDQAQLDEALRYFDLNERTFFPVGWRRLFENARQSEVLQAAERRGFDALCRAYVDGMKRPELSGFSPFWIQIGDDLPVEYYTDTDAFGYKLTVRILSAVINCDEAAEVRRIVQHPFDARMGTRLKMAYPEADREAREILTMYMEFPVLNTKGEVDPNPNNAPIFAEYRIPERIQYIVYCRDRVNAERIARKAIEEGRWYILDLMDKAYQVVFGHASPQE